MTRIFSARWLRRVLVVGGVIGALLAGVAAARAHALLIGATPAENSQLAQAPAQIELFFSEPLESALSTIEVFDEAGARRDIDGTRLDPADPTRLTVSLRALPAGQYSVVWRVASTTDGHVTEGGYAFSVGPAAVILAPQVPARPAANPIEVIARGLRFAAVMVLLGGGVGIWWLVEPTQRPVRRRSLLWGLVLFWPAHMLFWLVTAAAGGDQGLLAAPWSVPARQWLIETRAGSLWLVQALLAVLTGVSIQWSLSARGRGAWVTLAGAAALSAALAAGGHSASAEDGIGLPGAILHGWAASIWVGGVLILAIEAVGYVPSRRARHHQIDERQAQISRLLGIFTPLGLGATIALGLTGALAGLRYVGTFSNLTTTPYGQILAVKMLLVVVMAALAIRHFLAGRRPKAPDSARHSLWAEAILGVCAFAFSGLLTASPPAYTPPLGLTATQSVEEVDIQLAVSPARIGLNAFQVRLSGSLDATAGVEQVRLRFVDPAKDAAPAELQLAAVGDRTYAGRGAGLSHAAEWDVQVIVQRKERPALALDFRLPLSVPVSPTNTSVRTLDLNFGLLLAFTLALPIGLWAAWPSYQKEHAFYFANRWSRVALSGMTGLALVSLSGTWIQAPRPAQISELENPVSASPESLEAGRRVYVANCAECHGVAGAGDGPVGMTLNPRPIDLRIHSAPGIHSDGTLFLWITQGIPGSQMPAFAGQINNTERWQLVNYLRSLAEP